MKIANHFLKTLKILNVRRKSYELFGRPIIVASCCR